MDIFIDILGGVAALLIATGVVIINRRDLEIGALVGFIPLVWGIGIGALAAILWAIQHLSIHTV